ncbi:hypothetical protein [Gracilinema caldarium]|nr:hypothetical protein [Gracilinema caldarium]
MNFDNNGKDINISDSLDDGFIVSVKFKGNYFPSFGISRSGIFVNDLEVDPCDEGKYRRQSDKIWVNSTLVNKLLKNMLSFNQLYKKMDSLEFVNGPYSSTHNMIVNRNGDVIINEPGRGKIYSKREDSNYLIMTNFPIIKNNKIISVGKTGTGIDRFEIAKDYIENRKDLSIGDCFELLKLTSQSESEWKTDLSIVYDVTNNTVYISKKMDFNNIQKIELLSIVDTNE